MNRHLSFGPSYSLNTSDIPADVQGWKKQDSTSNFTQTGTMDFDKPYNVFNKVFVEFLGVALFVFIGSLSTVNATPDNKIICAALAHGLAIFILISAFGHISGGHFNPAVSFSVALAGKLNWIVAVLYWIAQFFGGLAGALLVRFRYAEIVGGSTTVAKTAGWHQILTVEMILTMILCLSVLTTAVDSIHSPLAALAIGLTVTADIFAGGSISGASMNPARSLPSALLFLILEGNSAEDVLGWKMQYVYLVGPLIGAILAFIVFRGLITRTNDRLF